MELKPEFQEIIEKNQRSNEKYEVFPYVFKYHESDEEFFYYIYYFKGEKGQGNLVLSNTRGLLNKQEAVDVAYYFFTHNGTAVTTNNNIHYMIERRSIEYILKLKESLLNNKKMFNPVLDSLNKLIAIMDLQVENTHQIKKIYNQIVSLDYGIHFGTKVLTKSKWKEGRNLLDQYNEVLYNENKTVLRNLPIAQNLIRHLYLYPDFNLIEKIKSKKIVKKLDNLYGKDAELKMIKSLEDAERDLEGNFFTKARGELSSQEFVKYVNKILNEDYITNLKKRCRNPE